MGGGGGERAELRARAYLWLIHARGRVRGQSEQPTPGSSLLR